MIRPRHMVLAAFALVAVALVPADAQGEARLQLLAQADGGDIDQRHDPTVYPTPGDTSRWEVPGSEVLRSDKHSHDDADEPDADVDADREEAAQLRREAADLQESLDRLDAQQKRGAKVAEDPEAARRHTDDVQSQISDLKHRARVLDDEASMLAEPPPSDTVKPGGRGSSRAPHVEKRSTAAARRAAERRREKDPLSDDIDDDLGDDLDGGMN